MLTLPPFTLSILSKSASLSSLLHLVSRSSLETSHLSFQYLLLSSSALTASALLSVSVLAPVFTGQIAPLPATSPLPPSS